MLTRAERQELDNLAVLAVAHGWPYERACEKFLVGRRYLRSLCRLAGVQSRFRFPGDGPLNPRRDEALAMLAHGHPAEQCAGHAGVHTGTLYRWRQAARNHDPAT